ncbi:MAG TPA: Crp/Fnr family transcriptional regulator [Bacteroidia bacterium]|nr:Crp/Fnr family transcriptional regulator [Bacteroidia bacterium]
MKFDIEKYHLKSLAFINLVPEKDAHLIKQNMVRREFSKGEYILRENSLSKGIYIVRKGKVKIFQTGEDGKESIVYFYRKGDFFGHRPILANEPNPVSALAMENVVVSYIAKDMFIKLLAGSDSLARLLLVNLSKEFTVWVNKMTIFTQYNLKKRVALSLLILHSVYRRNEVDSRKVNISIGRDDFASYVGTAKETLVRMLRHFKDEGIIVARGKNIRILDIKSLQELFVYL